MCYEGLIPGHDYFDQIQPGSILFNGTEEIRVTGKYTSGELMGCLSLNKSPHLIRKEQFTKEKWSISNYWRPEEEKYWGKV